MVDLSRNFMVYNIDRESSQARHADLVMKCIWKRADSIVKDLDKGVFTAGELLKVMETLFSVIPPSSWRAMGEQKIALGDMPLRTVKSMIQRIGSKLMVLSIVLMAVHCREDVYDSLAEAFGDADAGQSNVYQYLHKFSEYKGSHFRFD
jgi:cytoskeleton-associated protein 5